MKIPVYENQVGVQTPLARPMQVEGPRVPDVLPASYETNVGEATAQLGRTVQAGADVIESHIVKQQALNEEVMKETYLNNLKQHVQMIQYDQTPEDYTDMEGNTKQRPKGVMLQIGDQSKDALIRTRASIEKATADYANSIPSERVRAKFLAEARGYQISTENSVLSHEGQQYRLTQAKTMTSTLTNLENESATANTPEILDNMLVKIAEKSNLLSDTQGSDPETRQRTLDQWTAKATEKAVMNKLYTTGSIKESQALLESVKPRIPQETYDALNWKLEKGAVVLERKAARQVQVDKVNNRLAVIKDIMDKKINFENADDYISSVTMNDPEMGTAIQAAVDQQGYYTPTDSNNDSVQAAIESVFNSKSKEEVSNFLVKMLHTTNGKDIAQDKLNIVVNAVLNYASPLKDLPEDNDVQEDPKQIQVKAAAKSILKEGGKAVMDTLTMFFVGVNAGKTPQEAHAAASASTLIKQNPDLIKFPEGRIGVDRTTGIKWKFYPDGRKERVE